MKSIKLKLVIIYLTLVFIVMIVSGTFMITNIKMKEIDKAKSDLKVYARAIKEQVIERNSPEEYDIALEYLTTTVQMSRRIEGYILNKAGQTIAPSKFRHISFIDPTIISSMEGIAGSGSGKRGIDINGEQRRYITYSHPVINEDNKVEYVIFTRIDQEPILDTLSQFGITLFFTVILSLGMTALLGVLFANTITGPIIILTKKAKQIAQGNLKEKIPVSSKDEIGQLTESFNNMAKDLNTTISSMISEKNKLEILLYNMTDGVLAYDSDENIIHANSYFYELLGIAQKSNLNFEDIMKSLEIEANTIKELLGMDKLDKSISINDKYINVSFATYTNNKSQVEGILIVLQDITKHKKLDNMRKEFVANVSHEIRTPLTNIKSYSETLLYDTLEDKSIAKNFLRVINSEADRMTLLVKDLLELSRFDSEQLTLNLEKIDLNLIIKKCISQLEVTAKNKGQKINFQSPKSQYVIKCDPYRINQVITNVISNSIKYSKENSVIDIEIQKSYKYYVVLIKDSGIGIPEEDLGRIFERFYRVDKARSRAMGGTGLGLAISKEIMDMHKGRIYATSKMGEGTTMLLEFLREAY